MDAKLTATDELIREYTRDFMEKVFYFCLKKTGSPDEAEDLCSDISLAVISALKKGAEVKHFAAWVWKIAKNRYRVWAIAKHRSNELYVQSEEDVEVPDDAMGIEDGVILDEDLKLLRRELAFISSDYRDIIVRYYIDDLSVKDIAAALSLPEGTVKTRLYRARNILKEGMNMAREFGPKSYKPENIGIAINGNCSNIGEIRAATNELFPKNILIEAAGNPSTIEELSVALGVAVPYMEEQVKKLCDLDLLSKQGDKYCTNFIIVDRDAQRKAVDIMWKTSKERSALVEKITDDIFDDMKKSLVKSERISDSDLQFYLLLALSDIAIKFPTLERSICDTFPDAPYYLVGTEVGGAYFEDPYLGIGCWGSGGIYYHFSWATSFQPLMSDEASSLLGDIILKKRSPESFSDVEKIIWENEIDKKFAHIENGAIVPDLLVSDDRMVWGVPKKMYDTLCSHPKFETLEQLYKDTFIEIHKMFKNEATSPVKEQAITAATGAIWAMRGMVLRDLGVSFPESIDEARRSTIIVMNKN